MIIKRHQLDAFYQAVQKDLACKLVTHVERTFPAEVIERGDAAIRQQVRAVITLGESCGLADEYELCRLVDLTFLLGEDFAWFERQACVSRVLADTDVDEKARMDRLYDAFGERLAKRRSGGSPGALPSPEQRPMCV